MVISRKAYAFWLGSSNERIAPDLVFEGAGIPSQAAALLGGVLDKKVGRNLWEITFPRQVFLEPDAGYLKLLESWRCEPKTLIYLIPGMDPDHEESYLILGPGKEKSGTYLLAELLIVDMAGVRALEHITPEDPEAAVY